MISPVGDFPTLAAKYEGLASDLWIHLPAVVIFVLVHIVWACVRLKRMVFESWVQKVEAWTFCVLEYPPSSTHLLILPVVDNVINNRINPCTAHTSLTGTALLVPPSNTAIIL